MPHRRVFEFDDPYNLQATLRAGTYEVFPLGKGSFHAELTRVDFEHLWLQRCDTSANVLLRTAKTWPGWPTSVGETDHATEPFAHF